VERARSGLATSEGELATLDEESIWDAIALPR
jgi:hypothetical protein